MHKVCWKRIDHLKNIKKPKKKKIEAPDCSALKQNCSALKRKMNEAKENVQKYESFKIFGLIVGILATALGSKLLTVEDRSSFGGFIFICGIAMLGSALLCRQVAKEYTKEVEQEVGQLDKHLSETQQLLKKLYELDYIFPKYRNFVAICSIYEYFVSGRCTELTGADGAYNLYESELRQDLIINRLDKIIDSLEVIKENQYALYSELERTNEILNGISSDMRELVSTVRRIEITANRIEDAVHITNYYTQVTAQNTKALKYIALING